MSEVKDFVFICLLFVFGVALAALSPACSKSGADQPTVQVVPAPLPGFVCFGFYSSNGPLVGGNCVKE